MQHLRCHALEPSGRMPRSVRRLRLTRAVPLHVGRFLGRGVSVMEISKEYLERIHRMAYADAPLRVWPRMLALEPSGIPKWGRCGCIVLGTGCAYASCWCELCRPPGPRRSYVSGWTKTLTELQK